MRTWAWGIELMSEQLRSVTMQITLTDEQQRWIAAEVAAGHFSSVEAAVRAAVDNLMPGDAEDLTWVKPYLDEARAAAERGEVVPLGKVRADLAEFMRRLERE